jgi:hypothetical protein
MKEKPDRAEASDGRKGRSDGRIMAPGDYRYRGGDLGALVTRGRLQTDGNRLTGRCKGWIAGIRAQLAGTPLVREQPAPATQPSFKMA